MFNDPITFTEYVRHNSGIKLTSGSDIYNDNVCLTVNNILVMSDAIRQWRSHSWRKSLGDLVMPSLVTIIGKSVPELFTVNNTSLLSFMLCYALNTKIP